MSTFTDWNGPQGGGPAPSDWRTLIENYKVALADFNSKVDKEYGKGLSSNDYTAIDKAKVDKLGSASEKDVGAIGSGNTGLVTGEAVYQALLGYVAKRTGYDLSQNNYSNDDKEAVAKLRNSETIDKQVSGAIIDGDTNLVTGNAVYKAVEALTDIIELKYLPKDDFDAKAMKVLTLIKEQGGLDLTFQKFSAPVAGTYDDGVYYVLGMLGAEAGTAYIKYGNTTTFAAVVNFAVTESSAQLDVTANVEAANLHNVHFLIVKGTKKNEETGTYEQHNYLAISADEWQKNITDVTEPYVVGKFASLEFEGAGINFWPTSSSEYTGFNGECHVLADLDYRSVKDQIDNVESRLDNIAGLNDIGVIVAWSKYDEDGIAIDVPEGFHACDGTQVDESLTDVIAVIGDTYPLIDYHIIQIHKTVVTEEAD